MMKPLFICISAFLLTFQTFSNSVWNQKASLPDVGRHRGTGIAIGDKGYIGLGHRNGTGLNIVYQDWWEYDPATNSWTQKADFPALNYGALAFAIGNKGYVGGGVFLSDEFYEFDPITNQWTAISDAPTSPNDMPAFGLGNLGYIIDGATLYAYDPSNDNWSQKQDPPQFIGGWSSAFVIQSSAYVKTGSTLMEYKGASDQWIFKTNIPSGLYGTLSGGSAAFAVNGKGYIISGYIGPLSGVSKQIWEFDPATNDWTQQPDFIGTSRRFSVSFSIGNKGYIGTGTNGTNFNDFWEYNRVLSVPNTKTLPFKIVSYPNPSVNSINFKITGQDTPTNYRLKIYTIDGQLILDQIVNGTVFSHARTFETSGLYFYEIISDEHTLKGNFIFN